MISEYILKHRGVRGDVHLCPHIECADGLRLSVQASHFHYCVPRTDGGPYSSVEVGFPSERIEELMPYADEPESPTQTVYGYVPVEIVEAVIKAHGGSSQLD